jgi:spore coat polysaccharide biosynthesis predicted glycosyltransferase SpsG
MMFRVAASPRIGFGHLVRAVHLARAAGVEPLVSIRGGGNVEGTARRLGATPLAGGAASLIRPGLALLVIDDPSRTAATPWLRAARRAGVRVASIHDAGIAPLPSDLAIDGSVGARRVPALGLGAAACRLGPAYAVLSPDLTRVAAGRREAPGRPGTVVIGLGGGRHAAAGAVIARQLRSELARRPPARRPRVLLSLGLRVDGALAPARLPSGVTVVAPSRFREALAAASVAIVAGGTTLYEACALGTPAVAVPVVPGQRAPIRRVVRSRLAVATSGPAGAVGSARWARTAVDAALGLLADPRRRDAMSRRGRAAVDGRGAERVAAAIATLLGDQMPTTRTTR